MTIHAIYLSAGHNFFGHHGRVPDQHTMQTVSETECVAGNGLRGDRFFDYRPDYKGQVTLFSFEVFTELRSAFAVPDLSAAALRRNVLIEGLDLTASIGKRFVLQEVELEGTEECRPCHWMDRAVAPGVEAWLRGRGGLRCRILSDGWLRTGPIAQLGAA